ncbi:MAG: hypothetical protein AAF411_09555 [Myxococcota bacterium]
MASQRAIAVHEVRPLSEGRMHVRFELACGCVIERELASDRLIPTEDGPLLVGKYPCPVGHPLVRV